MQEVLTSLRLLFHIHIFGIHSVSRLRDVKELEQARKGLSPPETSLNLYFSLNLPMPWVCLHTQAEAMVELNNNFDLIFGPTFRFVAVHLIIVTSAVVSSSLKLKKYLQRSVTF